MKIKEFAENPLKSRQCENKKENEKDFNIDCTSCDSSIL